MIDPYDWVRCRTANGDHISCTKTQAANWKLEILEDHDALDVNNNPLPMKYKKDLGETVKTSRKETKKNG